MSKRNITHGSFTLERVYPASPARVYKALTDPVAKAKWFNGPEEWGPDEHHMDFRIGGRETSVGGPKGGPTHKMDGIYQDIVPNERIIFSYSMELDALRISVSLATYELRPEGEGTRLTLTEHGAFLDGYDDIADRKHGTNELLNALDAYLARQAGN